jgi:hypothetical protein
VEGQHHVRVTGSGSARATLVLDTVAGRLIRGEEEINAEIGITASSRTRRFSQHTARKIEQP